MEGKNALSYDDAKVVAEAAAQSIFMLIDVLKSSIWFGFEELARGLLLAFYRFAVCRAFERGLC